VEEWSALREARVAADLRIAQWADGLNEQRLGEALTWFSGAVGRELTMPLWVLVGHVFNHQTHHRGQAHALITRAGARPGDTDLPFILDLAALGITA
jgi:uncharacterized damage-inducible protein DinB